MGQGVDPLLENDVPNEYQGVRFSAQPIVRRRMPVHRVERQTSLGHGVGQHEFVAHVGLKEGRPEGFRHLAILPASGSRHTCSGRDASGPIDRGATPALLSAPHIASSPSVRAPSEPRWVSWRLG